MKRRKGRDGTGCNKSSINGLGHREGVEDKRNGDNLNRGSLGEKKPRYDQATEENVD